MLVGVEGLVDEDDTTRAEGVKIGAVRVVRLGRKDAVVKAEPGYVSP